MKEKNGISIMEFTSLNRMYENYIQSFPELTHLDLTANQIKLIELVLSYTRKGNNFYMNHTDIADHLAIGRTANRAKTVGNIIGQLKKKGYLTTVTTHNYNGRNGGSSTTIKVDEVFLEQMLLAVFNSESVMQETTLEPVETKHQATEKTFIEELEEMERENEFVELVVDPDKIEKTKAELKILETDCSLMDEVIFKKHLNKVIRLDYMKGWISGLQMLIENPLNWNIQDLRFGLEHLINQAKGTIEV